MPGIRIRRYSVADTPDVFGAVRESMAELTPRMPWCHPGYAVTDIAAWLESQVLAFDEGRAFARAASPR